MASVLASMVSNASPSRAAGPNALWNVAHDCCVLDQQEHGEPKPCALVDASGRAGRGFAVLKDLNGVAQFLLTPTERITGIEDPALLVPDAPNVFDAAWGARTSVKAQLRPALPRDAVGLVVNSVQGCSQEQLHIHVNCLKTDVREALRLHGGEVGPAWTPFPARLVGHSYMAMRVSGGHPGSSNPFKLLAGSLPGAQGSMGWTVPATLQKPRRLDSANVG